MNLAEFIGENGIENADGEQFEHSPESLKMQEFEKTHHKIRGVLFPNRETHEIKEVSIVLKGTVQEEWDRGKRTMKRRFLVERTFEYPDMSDGLETIEDAVPAGTTIDQAVEMLEAERQRFEFFKRYDLIDTGRYWLNRELKRCIVEDGKVVVMGH